MCGGKKFAIAGVLPQRCRCCRVVTNNRSAGHECNLLSIYIVGDNTNDGVVHTKEFAFQKFAYIHNNPVEAGIVEKAEEYIYSSAGDFYYGRNVGLLKIKFWDE
jgi:hypothetical protein